MQTTPQSSESAPKKPKLPAQPAPRAPPAGQGCQQEVPKRVTRSAARTAKQPSKSKTIWKIGKNLHDGMKILVDDALDTAEIFLGPGYKDMGRGRFLSADGTRQVRMTNADLTSINNHAGAPHINFEYLIPNPRNPGKMIPNKHKKYHIFLKE